MKSLSLFFLLAAPLHAELLATFATTRGDVLVSLHFDKTPQTVANFITLAQGTRSRIDPATGAVIRKPLYAGEKFFRVVSDEFSGGYALTGSGTGTVTGGPGYTLRDEFDASLPHGPYVLAMRNEGTPHTNGSQIYFTGKNGFPPDVGKNTVFGRVSDSTSQKAIDAILAAGNDGTVITSVSFQRTGAALAFNEHAQDLPICEGVKGRLQVSQDGTVSYVLDFPQPEGSFFLFARSPDLQGWSSVNKLYQGTGYSDTSLVNIEDATASRAFYNIATVRHPDAMGPVQSVLADDTLSINLDSGRNLVFNFTSGEVGTLTDSATSGSAAFTVVSYFPEPYKAIFIMESGALSYRFDCILDDDVAGQVIGRCVAYEKSGDSWISLGAGILDLTQIP